MAKDGQEWFLCRDDLKRLSTGNFEFDDGRVPIEANAREKELIIESVKGQLSNVVKGIRFADLGGGHNDHFRQNADRFKPIEVDDLGRYVQYEGQPYVFLGSRPRARKCCLSAMNLRTGKNFGFAIDLTAKLLGKS